MLQSQVLWEYSRRLTSSRVPRCQLSRLWWTASQSCAWLTQAAGVLWRQPGWHAPRKRPRQPFISQSAVRQSANGVRLISQLSQLELYQRHVCRRQRLYLMLIAMLSQFYLYYGLHIVGAMFKFYLYNITVFNSQFLSCWQSMAYG